MLGRIIAGAAAGAVGTTALNMATYADMVLRARPSSDMPAETAGKLAARAGIDLAGGAGAMEQSGADGKARTEKRQNRQSGLGALMGYVAGLSVGAVYGAVSPLLDDAPIPVLSLGLGAAAMAAGDGPPIALGLTSPKEWDASSWAADIVPHLAYGLTAALTFRAISRR